MRTLVFVCLHAACGSNDPTPPPAAPAPAAKGAPAAEPAPVAKPSGPTLAVDHVTLLQPEAVIGERVADVDTLSNVVQAASDAIVAYDGAHPHALPDDLDAILVARKDALRVWLVAATGDLAIPALDTTLAALPKVAVTTGNVAVVITLVRAGTTAPKRDTLLPAAWKQAASAGPMDIDHVIDAVWK
jgi:hypothetical protein